MANLEPIRTEEEYEAALARIHELFHAPVGTPDGDELDSLVDLVEIYAAKHYPIDPPSPSAAIEYQIDQTGKAPRDLTAHSERPEKVSKASSSKRQSRTRT